MMSSPHIVVVDDEAATRAVLAGHFATEGFRVSEVPDALELRALLARDPAHLVSLDIRLPGEDGLSLLRDLRTCEEDLAIMVVTVRNGDTERMQALELGADDYLVKPVNERELVLRARNILRRTRVGRPAEASTKRYGNWLLDPHNRRVTAPDGSEGTLTRGEFELLSALMTRADHIVSRRELLAKITHRGDMPNERTVDVLVGRLRRKIEPDPPRPRHIQTRHGRGYVFRL